MKTGAAAHQGTPRTDRSHQKLTEAGKGSSPEPSEGARPRCHPDFGIPASRSVRESVSRLKPPSLGSFSAAASGNSHGLPTPRQPGFTPSGVPWALGMTTELLLAASLLPSLAKPSSPTPPLCSSLCFSFLGFSTFSPSGVVTRCSLCLELPTERGPGSRERDETPRPDSWHPRPPRPQWSASSQTEGETWKKTWPHRPRTFPELPTCFQFLRTQPSALHSKRRARNAGLIWIFFRARLF